MVIELPAPTKDLHTIQNEADIAKLQQQMAEMQKALAATNESGNILQGKANQMEAACQQAQSKVGALETTCKDMGGKLGALEAACATTVSAIATLTGSMQALEQSAATNQSRTEDALAAILAKLDGDGPRKKPATPATTASGR